MSELTTLCYIEQNGHYLMMHRVKKSQDVNKDKWIGIGGHFEKGESPVECLKREVKEETGFELLSWRARGIVTFLYGKDTQEYMHLYTAQIAPFEEGENSGEKSVSGDMPADGNKNLPPLPDCDEGELVWVPVKEVPDLPIWEGDKIFLKLLEEDVPFFSLKLVYDEDGNLLSSKLE
ncbi:MAG: 8-oxo-dGTP diphosphatase [Lachnospiraceae bacterium]|nr:8-oxo-dGTP diphosphatase [Lachnospiraceae bacterium]